MSLTAVACGGVDRSEYIRKNLLLLDSLPVPAGARVKATALPASASPRGTVDFYRRRMHAWHVEDLSEAPSISLSRGGAYVHVLAGVSEFVVEVDHNCFKSGSRPRCFGP